MAYNINQVNVAANATMQVLIDQVNKSLNAISTFVLTVNTSTGALDTGANFPDRISIGNSSVNTIVNTSTIVVTTVTTTNLNLGIIVANTTVFQIGSNVVANSSAITVGNSSVKSFINSSMMQFGGSNVVTISNRTAVAKNGSLVGTRSVINLIEGSNITLTVTDDASGQVNVSIASTATGGGGSTPGGSNTQVQYNDQGVLGGDSGLTYDDVSKIFTVANTVSAQSHISNCTTYGGFTVTFSNTSTNNLDSFILLNYRSVEYTIVTTDNTSNSYQSTKLNVLHAGGTPLMTEYARQVTNSDIASFSITSNSTHGVLQVTPASSANVTYKVAKISITV